MVLCGVPILDYQVNGREYERVGNRSRYPAIAPHNTYRCAGDDRWIAIVAETEEQWSALCDVLDLDCALDPRFSGNDRRKRHEDVLDAAIDAATRNHDPVDLMRALQLRGVPAGLCQRSDDKMERDPQLAARDFYPTAVHPALGEHRFEGYPVQFSEARWRINGGAPLFGGDNHDVLPRLLGYSDTEVATLITEAAI